MVKPLTETRNNRLSCTCLVLSIWKCCLALRKGSRRERVLEASSLLLSSRCWDTRKQSSSCLIWTLTFPRISYLKFISHNLVTIYLFSYCHEYYLVLFPKLLETPWWKNLLYLLWYSGIAVGIAAGTVFLLLHSRRDCCCSTMDFTLYPCKRRVREKEREKRSREPIYMGCLCRAY